MAAETIYYDVFTYHDVSSRRPLEVGDELRLDSPGDPPREAETWYVRKVGPPVHEGKALALYCKLVPDRAPFPETWEPAGGEPEPDDVE